MEEQYKVLIQMLTKQNERQAIQIRVLILKPK